ncbi:MAG: peptide ABC transporter ATP-binding protein [Chlamydiae bacterium SM23_39]|nr:MAG: peptide ABC transporter ATP-binding protein [Chlamydiae bacterium SM23_39]
MIIETKNLTKYFFIRKKILKAVDNINFNIKKGETLGLVGESGCGKSTLARVILRLIPQTAGEVFFNKTNIFDLSIKEFKKYRKKMQIIFQDPYSSLNPRMTIKEILEEPLKIHKIKGENIYTLLDYVKMSKSCLKKFPHEFSGGQRQRITIARALSLNPEFLILDEPISSLDVSIQAQIINLLKTLQKNLKLTYLFIAHDLAVVKYISTQIAVMYLGEIVEQAPSEKIFKNPFHPYTKNLINSSLKIKKETLISENELPPQFSPIKGCNFSNRCPYAKEICFQKKPFLKMVDKNHHVSCSSISKKIP